MVFYMIKLNAKNAGYEQNRPTDDPALLYV